MAQKIIIPSLNYDQQSMPTNPATGQVWRERDSSNNILETWTWNGTYWLSFTKYMASSVSNAGALSSSLVGQNAPFVGSAFYQGAFLLEHVVSGGIANTPQDTSNYWGFRLLFNNVQYSLCNGYEIPGLTTGNVAFSKKINQPIMSPSTTLVDFEYNKTASPGALRRIAQSVVYNLIHL